MMNLVSVAQVGDAVYAARVRTYLLLKRPIQKPNDLHRLYAVCESARFQAARLEELLDQKFFNEEEQAIIQRGKNQSTATKAKNATKKEYRYATALEAIIGWFKLDDHEERLDEIFKYILEKCGE